MATPDFFSIYQITSLNRNHNRSTFDCGQLELNDYFKHRAGQDARRNVASVWVAVRKEKQRISGFYTLSMAAVPLDRLPEAIRYQLPRYGNIPAVLLGRLAVDRNEQGYGLGKYLLTDAILRCLHNEIAWAFFLVDAKDETARAFYENFGFFSLIGNRNNLYMPRAIVEREYYGVI